MKSTLVQEEIRRRVPPASLTKSVLFTRGANITPASRIVLLFDSITSLLHKITLIGLLDVLGKFQMNMLTIEGSTRN